VQENAEKETQYRSEKVNNLKYSKTKLAWFSCLLQHSARKQGGLFYNAPELTRGHSLYKHAHMWTKAKSTEVVKCSVVELLAK